MKNGMTNKQLNTLLEQIAKLIEALTGNTDAAKIVRDVKFK